MLILYAALTAWSFAQAAQTARPAAAAAEDARRALATWFECEECTQGELDQVRKHGDFVVPTLGSTLRQGPPAGSREAHRQHLLEAYREMSAAPSRADSKLSLTEEQYVARYLGNFDNLYRIRAAQGLAAIATPKAEQELRQAATADLSSPVRTVVQNALRQVQRQQQQQQQQ